MKIKKVNPSETTAKKQGGDHCPFLQKFDDPAIRYGFAHAGNYCHKTKKPQPVSCAHQEKFCLTDKYLDCDVYQAEFIRKLPVEIRGRGMNRRNLPASWLIAAIGLLIVLAAIILFFVFPKLPGRASEMTAGSDRYGVISDVDQIPATTPSPDKNSSSASAGIPGEPVFLAASGNSEKLNSPTLEQFPIPATGNPGLTSELPSSLSDETLVFIVRNTGRFSVNIRELPSIKSKILGSFKSGNEAAGIGRTEDGTWVFINFQDISGWVDAELVQIFAPVQAMPIFSPEESRP